VTTKQPTDLIVTLSLPQSVYCCTRVSVSDARRLCGVRTLDNPRARPRWPTTPEHRSCHLNLPCRKWDFDGRVIERTGELLKA
jgi:hypothetical protein